MKLHLYPKDVSLGKQIMREVNHCFFLMSLNVNFINLGAPAVNFLGPRCTVYVVVFTNHDSFTLWRRFCFYRHVAATVESK